MDEKLRRRCFDFENSFNLFSVWENDATFKNMNISVQEKKILYDRKIKNYLVASDFVKEFYRDYMIFKEDFDKLPKFHVSKQELYNHYVENDDLSLQYLLIWLDEINSDTSDFLKTCSYKSANIFLIHRIEDGEDKYFALLDNGFAPFGDKDKREYFDIDEEIVKNYLDVCHAHKDFLYRYEIIRKKKDFIDRKIPAFFAFNLEGDVFSGISKCHIYLGNDFMDEECSYLKATYDFYPELKLKFVFHENELKTDKDETVVFLGKKLTSESEVRECAEHILNSVYVKKKF